MAAKNIEFRIVQTNIDKVLDEATDKSTLELAIKGTALAKALAPVKGGRLRNSIMWKTKTKDGGLNDSSDESAPFSLEGVNIKKKEAIVGFNLNYGIYQEFGTRRMKPQPFLRPSLAIMKGADSVDIIEKIQAEELRGKLKTTKVRETFL